MTGLPAGFTHRVDGDADVIGWSNRRVPKDRALVAVMLFFVPFWTACTFVLTAVAVRKGWEGYDPFGTVILWLFFIPPFWAAEVLALRYAPTVLADEELRVSADRLDLWRNGRLRDTAPADRFEALVLCKAEEEAVPTLSLLPKPDPSTLFGWQRRILAYWVRPAVKSELFNVLRAIFERRGWTLEYRNDLAPAAEVSP